MSRALIVNAYAIGNHGDAAIVQGLIAALRDAGATHLTVAPRGWRDQREAWRALGADEVVPPLISQHDAPSWARRHRLLVLAYVLARIARLLLGARFGRRGDAAARAYADATLVVSAGGAYLGGPKVGINLVKGMNIAFARSVERPMILAPMTINPPGGAVRRLLRWALAGTRIFVRDEPSRDRVRALGLDAQLVPDLAFRAPAVRAAQPTADAPSARILCWSPRAYRSDHDAWADREALEARCVAAVETLLRSTDLRLRFIPQVTASHEDDDRRAIDRMRARLPAELADRVEVCEAAPTLEGAVEQFASCDILLASRLHATILAMASGVPSLTVGYEPKVAGVLDGIGLADRVVAVVGNESGEELAGRLGRLREPEERQRTLVALASTADGFGPLDAALREALAR